MIDQCNVLEVVLEEDSELHADDDLAAKNENARFIYSVLDLVVQARHLQDVLRESARKLFAQFVSV
ncbi:hypothetical protein [Candidatus Korobacter versatilis]|uniref:hypothetical protein n=1 Tax=Candidatus Korobacter versatilis TaxID=658062 RepID=UPI0003220C5A|nr:hypothetical protein [Candidatus Koribacter versatilis]